MYATDFEYDNKRLSEFNMMICSLNGNSGIESVSSGADLVFNQGKSSGYDKFNLYSSTYDSAYTTTFQICKDPCKYNSVDELYIYPKEVSELQMWLCRKQYNKFKIDQDNYRDIFWMSTFSSKQINFNGKIIGLELTMHTDSPYAYHDEIVYEFTTGITTPAGTVIPKDIEFSNLSDKEGFLYPVLEISLLQNGDLHLDLNNRTTLIANCSRNEVITIKGDKQIISSSNTNHNIAKDFNFIFPRLETSYKKNKNIVTTNLNCKIILKYAPIVLIGL